jgi:cation transport protein ChaC
MARRPRIPALTRALIAVAHPAPIADDGDKIPLRGDAELRAMLEATLEQGGVGEELWLFAYGSLLWKPEIAFAEHRIATVRGWHRRFCLWQWRYRGTRQKPNLMLALDRGGACKGVAYRIDAPDIAGKLFEVWKREMVAFGYLPRWLTARTDAGPVRSLAFVANHGGERYAGRFPADVVAAHIATACGHVGPGAEYLCEAVHRLEELGIHDRALWELQALVAERLGPGKSR